jgi:hypothetical protein
MERTMKSVLPYRREAFRLWFEYLRVARSSLRPEVQEALKRTASFYAPWGDVTETKFDDWWKDKGHLFEDKYVVRRLEQGELPADPQALILEIPLTQSPTVLVKRVAEIIAEACATRQQTSLKSKKTPTSQFQLTAGAEPKLTAVREMLTVYRDVYLKNPQLRGKAMLNAVEKHYLGRKNKRWAKIPNTLSLDANANEKDVYGVLRNLRRYITKAERVMLNVASGQFPGSY